MNSIYNGILYGMTKQAGINPWLAGGIGAVGLGLTGLGLYDVYSSSQNRTRQEDIDAHMSRNATNVKKRVLKANSKVNLVSSVKDVGVLMDKEFKGNGPKEYMENVVLNGGNALAFSGDTGDYIIAPKKMNPVVIDHEIGHIADFSKKRDDGELATAYGGANIPRGLARLFSKKIHDEDVMEKERVAWSQVADGEEKSQIEEDTGKTYLRNFHQNRGRLVSTVGGTMVGSMFGPVGALAGMALGQAPVIIEEVISERANKSKTPPLPSA